MIDITALGELLIYFTPVQNPLSSNLCFERNPGGAPANVLAAAARLGSRCAFLGKVGKDNFGNYLKKVLDDQGILTEGLAVSEEAGTTLAFVELDEHGDRTFSFYRRPGADILLTEADLNLDLIDQATIFHFGSLSLTDEPARSATLSAIRRARREGKILSYDPNYRPPLWKNEEKAVTMMKLPLGEVDILKISETELALLTGETRPEAGAEKLHSMGIEILLITLGPKGCFYSCPRGSGFLPTYDTKVVDTTGSGDAFFGSFLSNLCRIGVKPADLGADQLRELADFSNAAGALCAAARGAIPAMPDHWAVEECMRTSPKLIG